MMKSIYLFLLSLFITTGVLAGKQDSSCTASLADGILTIGNNRFTVYYDLSSGIDQLVAYKITGHEKTDLRQSLPNLKVSSLPFDIATPILKREWKQRFDGEEKFLEVRVTFRTAQGYVERIWEIYPDVSAISNRYRFKGKWSQGWLWGGQVDRTELIEDVALLENAEVLPYYGVFPLNFPHWQIEAVSFEDATDHHNNLVKTISVLPYVKPQTFVANLFLLQNKINRERVFILKSSPLGKSQQSYPGYDFLVDNKRVLVTGPGLSPEDMPEREWMDSYAYILGFTGDSEAEQLTELRKWQKKSRKLKDDRDEMIMSNTWGDRSKDGKMNEQFILQELAVAKRLGITHFQLDDGWQQGISKNSADKEGMRWETWDATDWQPHQERFPNGLTPIVEKAEELGITIGLWFNPGSGNNYRDWETSANILIDYYQRYGVKVFKIDGVELRNKESELNLGKFFERILTETQGDVVFNLDVTAGRRSGYHFFSHVGNIFLENRYTDWGNYYPHYTLRNLWQLSRYIPVEKLQAEWLNTWRNVNKYPTDDPLRPQRIPWDYQMATTFAAQPLAWMEISNLPQEAFEHAPVLTAYRRVQHDFHQGVILPIGSEPDGFSWTGFQSIGHAKSGYFLVYREKNNNQKSLLKTYLKPGTKVKLSSILEQGRSLETVVTPNSELLFELPQAFSFGFYRYEIP